MQLSETSKGITLAGKISQISVPLLFGLAHQARMTGDLALCSSTQSYEISFQNGRLVGIIYDNAPLLPISSEVEEHKLITALVKAGPELFALQTGEFVFVVAPQPAHIQLKPERLPLPFFMRYAFARTKHQALIAQIFRAICPESAKIHIHAKREILALMGNKVEEDLAPYRAKEEFDPRNTPVAIQQILAVLWCIGLLDIRPPTEAMQRYDVLISALQKPPETDLLPQTYPAPLGDVTEAYVISSQPVGEIIAHHQAVAPESISPPESERHRLHSPRPPEISDDLLTAVQSPEVIDSLLRQMENWRASDLFLSEDKAPALRIHGQVVSLPLPQISRAQFQHFQDNILTGEAIARFQASGDLDVGYSISATHRFRINFHRQKGVIAMVARAIPSGHLSLETLGLPAQLRELADLQRGLILITGATGSGKSTTLAAMIHHINSTRHAHIITIEEPIEFIHQDLRSRITQREVGSDTASFQSALRHIVRESPDVILIGEMRDMETMTVALSAALTGHLVFATLHTIDAVQTVQRIMSYYPEHLRHQVATDLSLSLQGIVSQRLLPNIKANSRVVAIEMLTVTPAVAQLLRQQRVPELHDILEHANDPGICSFNRSLIDLFRRGQIDYDIGKAYATNPDQFALAAQGMETGIATFRTVDGLPPNIGIDLKSLLKLTLERGASDLHLTSGRPPILRINGHLYPLDYPPLNEADMRRLLFSTLSTPQRTAFQLEREIDFALSLDNGQRFRINAYHQKGKMAAAMRAIPSVIPSAENLAISESILELVDHPHGLLLVTGPTGSGKSTTLACMIDRINRTRPCRIITIEDPIEFTHESILATIDQREVFADTKSFASALKYILRQDPDVVLIGEMRDLETISAALTAAETGHLVLATLHTNSAIQTIARIVDVFPAHQQAQVRSQLSASLLGVVSQRLLIRHDQPGRIAAFEIMIANPAIRNLIREDKMHQARSIIESSRSIGMITLDYYLQRLYQANVISYQDAIRYITNPQLIEPNHIE